MSDEVRDHVYQSARPRGPDPMTMRLMVIAGGLSVVLVAVVVLWSSVGHRPAGPVPVVQADPRPFRVKPLDPGGMVIPRLNADLDQAVGTRVTGRLAPAPEAPDPQALEHPPPAATPVAPTRAAPGPTGTGAAQAAAPLRPAPSAPAPSAPTAVQPVTSASVAPAAPTAAAPPVTAAPAASAPTSAPTAPTPVAPVYRALAPAAPAAAGQTQVQLAAVGTEAAARQEWARLARRMPDLLGTQRPVFSQVERDGHVLWRVRTGGFASAAEASLFCQEVRAKGGGCTVATF